MGRKDWKEEARRERSERGGKKSAGKRRRVQGSEGGKGGKRMEKEGKGEKEDGKRGKARGEEGRKEEWEVGRDEKEKERGWEGDKPERERERERDREREREGGREGERERERERRERRERRRRGRRGKLYTLNSKGSVNFKTFLTSTLYLQGTQVKVDHCHNKATKRKQKAAQLSLILLYRLSIIPRFPTLFWTNCQALVDHLSAEHVP